MPEEKVSPDALVSNDISPDGSPLETTAKTPIKVAEKTTTDGPSIKDSPAVLEKEVDPSKIIDEENPISLDDFIEAGSKLAENFNKDKKEEVVKEKKELLDPAKIVENEPKVEIEKPVKDDGARDYSNIDEADLPHFKKMGNDAFKAFKPVYLERKQLKDQIAQKEQEYTKTKQELDTIKKSGPQIPDSYYEHPGAYVLDPQFTNALQEYNNHQSIANHWEKQLDAIAEGAREVDLLELKDGQYITKTTPVDRALENKIKKLHSAFLNSSTSAKGKLESIAHTYKERHTNEVQKINDLGQQYFNGLYKTEESKKIYEPIVRDTLNNLPPVIRNSPAGKFVAESLTMVYALGQLLQQKVTQEQQGKNGKGKVDEGVTPRQVTPTKTGPTAGEAADHGGVVTNGKAKGDISWEDFEKAKNE